MNKWSYDQLHFLQLRYSSTQENFKERPTSHTRINIDVSHEIANTAALSNNLYTSAEIIKRIGILEIQPRFQYSVNVSSWLVEFHTHSQNDSAEMKNAPMNWHYKTHLLPKVLHCQ